MSVNDRNRFRWQKPEEAYKRMMAGSARFEMVLTMT